MSWEKLPVIEGGVSSGCLHCGTKPTELPLTKLLAVGFGEVVVTKDRFHVWSEGSEGGDKLLEEFEKLAQEDPDHDWRVSFDAPMYSATWQRQGHGKWMLVAKGDGFA